MEHKVGSTQCNRMLQYNIRKRKSRRMRWAEYIARIGAKTRFLSEMQNKIDHYEGGMIILK
jgi:hypothetical protein